jgi:hypothetical protein
MISKELDGFIIDKDKTYWKAILNNGETVYQDDGKFQDPHPSAWLRLKRYCEENNLYPTDMWITFRSHTEYCGHSDVGFFFSLGILASPGSENEHRYICGPIIGEDIHVKAWKVPEILEQESYTRPIIGNEEKIIWNSSLLLTDISVRNSTT